MILIADSGSTSIEWSLVWRNGNCETFLSNGANPVFLSPGRIAERFRDALLPYLHSENGSVANESIIESEIIESEEVEEIYYYGAGVIPGEPANKVMEAFRYLFPRAAKIEVHSDMLGAARALFGNGRGLACILGTGSNCALYEAGEIVEKVNSGGFILGDEGGGANMGLMLIADFVKGLLPSGIEKELKKQYPEIDYPSIVGQVYKGEMPSKYLAGFTYFIKEWEDDPYISSLIARSFDSFFERNLVRFLRRDSAEGKTDKAGFVGSVAKVFESQLIRSAQHHGFTVTEILDGISDGLIKYHSKEQNGQ